MTMMTTFHSITAKTCLKSSDEKLYIVITIFLLWIGFMNLILGCCLSQEPTQVNIQNQSPISGAQPNSKNQPVALAPSVDNSV
jgi:hypothetical protein